MELVYNGWHKIELLYVKIKGKLVKREFLHLYDGVGAVITDEEGKIGLVKQFRAAINDFTFEIPAGILDKNGLNTEETLIEELQEECNIHKNDILHIEKAFINKALMVVGSSDASMNYYRVKVKKQPDFIEVDDVDVEGVYWVSFDEFEKMFLEEKIVDNKTIMSYLMLKLENHSNKKEA